MKDYYMWKRSGLFFLVIGIFVLSGCANVELTTGFKDTEYAKIGGLTIKMDRAELLLAETKYTYQEMFNFNIWNESIHDSSMEEYTYQEIQQNIQHIAYLELMADDLKIEITQTEEDLIEQAALEYYNTLDQEILESYQFDVNTVVSYYKSLLLAEKSFYKVTENVDTEVSTDEARMIDVQYIFISTMEQNESGEFVSLSNQDLLDKKEQAQKILEKVNGDEDFLVTARAFSDDSENTLELGRGVYDLDFENAAFELEMGEISDLVESDYGYYIIKCVNDNVESDYDLRSEEVVLGRRSEVFKNSYTEFTESIISEFNDDFLGKQSIEDVLMGSGQLYSIYQKYFVSTQL